MNFFKNENHICELQSEELNEEWLSQLHAQLLQLQKGSLKKILACTGFEPLTSVCTVLAIKLTSL